MSNEKFAMLMVTIITLTTIVGTGYVVFVLGCSGWWWLLAFLFCDELGHKILKG